MAVIDSLIISLGVDPKGVSAGMQKAQTQLRAGAASIIKNVVAPLTAALAVGGMLKDFLASADAVGKLSARLGENGEDLQAWGEAAKRAGGSTQGLYNSVQSISKATSELVQFGSGAGREVFARLGISALDSSGKVKQSTQILQELANVAGTMDKQQFAGIASKLGLDSGTIQLLQQGGSAVSELVARQKELGVYSQADMEAAAAANDAIADLLQSFKALAASILRIIVPALTWMSNILTSVIVFLRNHKPFVISAIVGIAAAITGLMIPSLLKMIPTLAKVGAAWLMNPMTWVIMAIVAAVGALALIIDDLVVYMHGGQSALSGFWSKFGTGEEIAETLGSLWENIKTIFSATISALAPLLPLLLRIGVVVGGFIVGVKIFTAIKTAITAVTMAVRMLTLAFASNPIGAAITVILGLVMLLITYWDDVKKVVFSFFSALREKAAAVGAFIANIFRAYANFIKNFWSTIIGWIIDKIRSVIDILPDFIKSKLGIAAGGSADAADAEADTDTPVFPDISAAESVSPTISNSNRSINTDTKIDVGQVNIQTAATDAPGIAGAIGGALSNSFERDLVFAANSGVIQK